MQMLAPLAGVIGSGVVGQEEKERRKSRLGQKIKTNMLGLGV